MKFFPVTICLYFALVAPAIAAAPKDGMAIAEEIILEAPKAEAKPDADEPEQLAEDTEETQPEATEPAAEEVNSADFEPLQAQEQNQNKPAPGSPEYEAQTVNMLSDASQADAASVSPAHNQE